MVIVGRSSIEPLAIFDPALGVFVPPFVLFSAGEPSQDWNHRWSYAGNEPTCNHRQDEREAVELSRSQSGLLRVKGKAWTISTAPVETERPPEWIAPHTAGR